MAQRTVSGKVISGEKSTTRYWGSVVVKGSKNSALSDESGNYKIEADYKDRLIISSIGFLEQEISAANAATIRNL